MRIRLRFSLRSVLIGFAVFGLLLGYFAHRVRQQRHVSSLVAKAGGSVEYHSDTDYVQMLVSSEGTLTCTVTLKLWEPEGVRGMLPSVVPPDWVDCLGAVNLGGTVVPRETLLAVSQLPHLEYLRLSEARFKSQDLPLLANCHSLKYLHLSMTPIRDKDLDVLGRIKSLEELSLDGTPVTDAGLKVLVGLPNLKNLWLGNTGVTIAGTEQLKKCTALEQLMLRRTKIDDTGLRRLAALNHLKVLDVEFTSVTEAGVRDFHRMQPNCRVAWGDGIPTDFRDPAGTLPNGWPR